MLYTKDLYRNKDIDYLISREIVEYDMKNAGFNIIKKFKLLPQSEIEYISTLSKKEKNIYIGKQQLSNPSLKENLKIGFQEMRKQFIEKNKLEDKDILSIKKDAIITLKRCYYCDFNPIKFVEKNIYTSYCYLNRLEIYIGKNYVDVKGIKDENLEKHNKYFLSFIFTFFKNMETRDKKYNIKFLTDFAIKYREGKLPIGYYRELNSDSKYKYRQIICDTALLTDHIDSIENINISYNYMNYILPFLRLLL